MYPVMINIRNKKVVLVGGGKVASRKIKTLLDEGANVTVISPEINSQIDLEKVIWIKKSYESGDLKDAKLVFACTDQASVNSQVVEDAAPSQLVNNTGDKFYSDFYNVAIARANDFSVMISTDGASAARSKEIRKKLQHLLKDL